MKWSELFTSSVGKKWVMALTGIFLILFLLYMLVSMPVSGPMMAAKCSIKRPISWVPMIVIRIMEIGLFLGILLHIIQGIATGISEP